MNLLKTSALVAAAFVTCMGCAPADDEAADEGGQASTKAAPEDALPASLEGKTLSFRRRIDVPADESRIQLTKVMAFPKTGNVLCEAVVNEHRPVARWIEANENYLIESARFTPWQVFSRWTIELQDADASGKATKAADFKIACTLQKGTEITAAELKSALAGAIEFKD